MFRAHPLLAPTLTVAVLATSVATASAQRDTVAVHVASIRGDAPSAATLRRALDERIEEDLSLRAVDRRRARFVVRGAVVDCERRRVGRQREVRCEVAWVISDASGETIRAVMSSTGTARGRHVRQLEQAALDAATRSVVATLANPRALTRRQPS